MSTKTDELMRLHDEAVCAWMATQFHGTAQDAKEADDALLSAIQEVVSAWRPIETAPKDGTEVLAWRKDFGAFIAIYTSPDCFPLADDEIEQMDDEALFAEDWFTQWPDGRRLEGSEAPTHWQPLPEPPEAS